MDVKKRQEFLKNSWRPYPVVKGPSEESFCGRVYQILPDKILLKNQESEHSIDAEDLNSWEHPELGASIPSSCLIVGDAVCYFFQLKALFLVSPCEQASEKLFDQSPKRWSEFLGQIESYFTGHHFLHLRTPYLVKSPGVDHHIDFMEVCAARSGRRWYLPTSPEISLKKYLCQGYDRIFEIKNCFRDDLPGPHHLHEFSMLEWYRGFGDIFKVAEDLRGLFQCLFGNSILVEEDRLPHCFEKYTSFILKEDTSKEELLEWTHQLGIEAHPQDQWNDVFFRIFMEKVETHLGRPNPLLVFDWPHQQASLARIQGGWSQRFELYWQGVELANAYQEVNDPTENFSRFQKEQELRRKEGRPLCDFDEDFFKEMRSAMPPAAGVALGLNRLFSFWNHLQ